MLSLAVLTILIQARFKYLYRYNRINLKNIY